MGFTVDYVIADVKQAQSVLEAPDPTARWPGIQIDPIDPAKLATLRAILLGKPIPELPLQAAEREFKELAASGEAGPWVLLLPDDLIKALAKLDAQTLAKVVDRWLETDEFQDDGNWAAEEVTEMLRALQKLALDAKKQGKPMLMYVSL